MKRLLAIGLSLGALAGAVPASAQDLTDLIGLDYSSSNEDIVVTHKPDPEPDQGEVHGQIREIAQSGNIFNEPLALFQAKLCPGVLGLPREPAELIVGRVRYNAERLGLSLASEEKCKPNLIIGFVGSGQSDIRKILEKKGSILVDMPLDERRALVNDTGPVHAFAITSTRTRDGMHILGDQKYGKMPTVNIQSGNSLIMLATRIDIELSVVLMDIAAIDGMTVNQLADYATMRGFAQTKGISGDTAYGTILNLFDPDAAHQTELSNFDVAYLTALYSNAPNLIAASKFGTVQGEMRKQLASAQEAEPAEQP